MNATGMRNLAIGAAYKEIESIEKQMLEASNNSETSIIVKNISGAAIAYLKDNGYEIDRKEIDISCERTVLGIVKISW